MDFNLMLDAAIQHKSQSDSDFQYSENQMSKKDWKNQIVGAYDLIFKHLHVDFPTRDEVLMAISITMQNHQVESFHFGKKSYPTGPITTIQPTEKLQLETADSSSGQQVRSIGENVNGIGYGA